jgi:hypothetical protein
MFGKRNRAWDERYEAQRIMRRDWVGEIAGVKFDFSAPELATDKWSCPFVLSADGWDHAGWYFVGNTSSTSPTLLGFTVGELEIRGREQARESGKIIVGVGDHVYVKETDWLSKATDELEPPVDQEVVSLRMVVRRNGGSEESAGTVSVRRRGVLPTGYAEFGVLDAMAERVELLAASTAERAEIETLQRRVDVRVEAFETEVRRLNPLLRDSGLLSAQFGAPFDVTRLVNIAALYGYRLGRAETQQNLKHHAKGKLSRRETDRVGQREAALVRTKWKKVALKLAKEFCRKDRAISNIRLADEIYDALAEGSSKQQFYRPTRDTIREVVAAWRTKGTLPKKEQRPKTRKSRAIT